MNWPFVVMFLSVLLATGCTTKAKARAQAGAAFTAGQNQVLSQSQNQTPVVTLIGSVRHRIIPWQEGLTLAQAIDAAVYTGFSDPRLIVLARGPERVEIRVNDLLRGTANPILEPGDIIEIRR